MADDLFGKKKDVVPVLDLSKATVTNKEELKRLMEKVPDYKMRPVKVRSEDIKIKDKDWSFRTPKKEVKALLKSNGERERPYTYLDPIPVEMKGGIKISDLCLVPIDWKMLTTLRPKTKIDEDFFSKLVEVRTYLRLNAFERNGFLPVGEAADQNGAEGQAGEPLQLFTFWNDQPEPQPGISAGHLCAESEEPLWTD